MLDRNERKIGGKAQKLVWGNRDKKLAKKNKQDIFKKFIDDKQNEIGIDDSAKFTSKYYVSLIIKELNKKTPFKIIGDLNSTTLLKHSLKVVLPTASLSFPPIYLKLNRSLISILDISYHVLSSKKNYEQSKYSRYYWLIRGLPDFDSFSFFMFKRKLLKLLFDNEGRRGSYSFYFKNELRNLLKFIFIRRVASNKLVCGCTRYLVQKNFSSGHLGSLNLKIKNLYNLKLLSSKIYTYLLLCLKLKKFRLFFFNKAKPGLAGNALYGGFNLYSYASRCIDKRLRNFSVVKNFSETCKYSDFVSFVNLIFFQRKMHRDAFSSQVSQSIPFYLGCKDYLGGKFRTFYYTYLVRRIWYRIIMICRIDYGVFYENVKFKFLLIDHLSVTSYLLTRFIIQKLRWKYRLSEVLTPLMQMISPFVTGFRITLSGRFTRAQRAFYSTKQIGRVPSNTISYLLDYNFGHVALKYGECSLKIWICRRYGRYNRLMSVFFYKFGSDRQILDKLYSIRVHPFIFMLAFDKFAD